MIKGVNIIERFGENDRVTCYSYKGVTFYSTTEEFEKMTEKDFEEGYLQAVKDFKPIEESIKKYSLMSKEERRKQNEKIKPLIERWQSETGYDDEDEE